ncbi:transcription factor LHW-like isoform X2 [Rhodamnia argentea]|uniref:Transcription factor LHW-like isoform X2 n=1 Tax=Rhodamnia argentea TaxID=178133 RepID=A0A8B8NIT5_9MYRT|nr:transcription factor LHW-like isoform X2 [Rhodamnia argentea]
MGYLLKEALKTICGVNQWSYAVFWKFGCQNPQLLIWEDCYYEPLRCCVPPPTAGSVIGKVPMGEFDGCLVPPDNLFARPENHASDKIQSLIDKMMIKNQINILGEGIIGRAAFTGNHQWILSSSYNGDAYPPEVQHEMRQQFSAGMQTVAVVPITPHGVIQVGSSLHIMENVRFVDEVRSLILQLRFVPGSVSSDTYPAKLAVSIGMPAADLSRNGMAAPTVVMSANANSSGFANHRSCSQITRVQDYPWTTALGFQTPNQPLSLLESRGQLGARDVGSQSACSTLEVWPHQQAASSNKRTGSCHQNGFGQSGVNHNHIASTEMNLYSDVCARNLVSEKSHALDGCITSQLRINNAVDIDMHKVSDIAPLHGVNNGMSYQLKEISRPVFTNMDEVKVRGSLSSNLEGIPLMSVDGHKTTKMSDLLSGGSNQTNHPTDMQATGIDFPSGQLKMESALAGVFSGSDEHVSVKELIPQSLLDFENCNSTNFRHVEETSHNSSGDDLFDILGVEFKNKILSSNFGKVDGGGLDGSPGKMGKETLVSVLEQDSDSALYSTSESFSESGVFLGAGAGGGDLLDAVITRAPKQCADDVVSCKTTITNVSSSSLPGSSPSYSCFSVLDKVQGESIGFPKPLVKVGTTAPCSFISGCSKEGTRSHSFCGSQISSWVEQSHAMKLDSSVSTGYSKKPDELVKSNRKRLKPGENPRPRPKDRQMIQDRVKELREIVPNGTKCSIDALLERTIKHMLFLQSVTKHGDKLKQTAESKIIDREGGLLLKDNFEGGATWAFEVGSQVCPIIVEDLNAPRQMLVEMLCQERGYFLEIADIIRGLGLTILKGVMEARKDNIWAQFAVEANRDVTRMEIFMSLVPLLEKTTKGGLVQDTAMERVQMVQPCIAVAMPKTVQ